MTKPIPPEPVPASAPPQLPGLRFPLGVVLLFWIATFVAGGIDKPYFSGFLFKIASTFLFALSFFIWWWSRRTLRLAERIAGFGLIVGGAWVMSRFTHPSVNIFALLFDGIPLVVTVLVLWMLFARRRLIPSARSGAVMVLTAAWGYFLLIRTDPPDASLKAKTHWRWTPTSEELFLAHPPAAAMAIKNSQPAAPSQKENSTGFRGPDRDGVVRGVKIGADWGRTPPAQVWKHAVGPAWSTVIVVDDRLFTQEQRGQVETVVCYDAATGGQLWLHEDMARFDEAVSGPGPRATPTFAKGRLFTLGGTGILNCLDAATGKLVWSRDIKIDSGAKVPMWGFASSPLVLDQTVIVYAGGDQGKGLLSYDLDSGKLIWSAPAGQTSYSSPELSTIAGVSQCLMLHDGGLTAVDPLTGKQLWTAGHPMKTGAPRSGQPRLIGSSKLAVASLDDAGISLINVAKSGDGWQVTPVWISKDLKPEFPDFVVHDGNAYGFDLSIFACLDLATGKRQWKEGRYGRGQVILLADQGLLLLVSETGEVVLLAADPHGERNLGRFQAVEGKTWNHPVVANGRLYLRNAVEMTCFTLPPG